MGTLGALKAIERAWLTQSRKALKAVRRYCEGWTPKKRWSERCRPGSVAQPASCGSGAGAAVQFQA